MSIVTKCKVCGARISWIKMRSGKAMSVNLLGDNFKPEPDGKGSFVTADGRVVKGTIYPEPKKNICRGYISHFATCPGAERMRKK